MKKIILSVLLLCFVGLFIFSGYKFLTVYREYREGEKAYESISDSFVRPSATAKPGEEAKNTPKPENKPGEDGGEAAEAPAEEKPLEPAPISVDFTALQAEIGDAIAWIYSPDTVINYPVLQTEDNSYYVYRMSNGVWNSNGAIFLDFRAASDFSDLNSVIYGYNMNNGAMFVTFEEYKKQEYYEEHPCLYILTPDVGYKMVLIGGYVIDADDETTYGYPFYESEREELIALAREKSSFIADVEVPEDANLLTLSTCAYDYSEARYVLVGYLEELAPAESSGQ